MQLTSDAFQHQQPIPQRYTCQGESIRPTFHISDIPSAATSLAFIVTDPDSPQGDYIHWLVWNIDPRTTALTGDSLPASAVEGQASTGQPGYIAPCPHQGEHRYTFELIALNTTLVLPPTSDVVALRAAMEGHILATSTLQGLYQKQQNA